MLTSVSINSQSHRRPALLSLSLGSVKGEGPPYSLGARELAGAGGAAWGEGSEEGFQKAGRVWLLCHHHPPR